MARSAKSLSRIRDAQDLVRSAAEVRLATLDRQRGELTRLREALIEAMNRADPRLMPFGPELAARRLTRLAAEMRRLETARSEAEGRLRQEDGRLEALERRLLQARRTEAAEDEKRMLERVLEAMTATAADSLR